jgi:hypothetical protein
MCFKGNKNEGICLLNITTENFFQKHSSHIPSVPSKRRERIICFKIKNPPTLRSTSKIQPTTSPTFVFSVFANVGKSGVMKENC